MARLYRGNKLITNLNIYKIGGGGDGASLNVAYGTTPPTDTSKIWLQCEEPQAVEVQNYLGECAVSDVANYGGISNPVAKHSDFYGGYYSSCYIGNNQIAIVGYNHVRIYDLISKKYIADYTISVGTDSWYSNVIYKNNVLYFGYSGAYYTLYSYDLTTQTLASLKNCGSTIRYISFIGENEIGILFYSSNKSHCYRYNIITAETEYPYVNGNYFNFSGNHTITVNNTIYNFYMFTITSTNYYTWKYDLDENTITTFTSFYNFMTNLGWTLYRISSVIYDGERYIYLIGGYGNYNGTDGTKSNLIIKYDTINDSFELLDQKLLGVTYNHFSVLVDGRVYIFGGGGTRSKLIDYFDLKYDLPQNNIILTINNKTDNNLPLINTDKLKLNSNIASAYKGNADNLAEKVNAYYWDGSKWIGINCEDYTSE